MSIISRSGETIARFNLAIIINAIKIFVVSVLTFIGVLKAPVAPVATTPIYQVTPSSSTTPVVRTVSSPSGLSANWAGYVATGGTFTAVSGTWTVPQVTSGGGNYGTDATWVGIGGVDIRDLIQAGTMSTVDSSGNVSYGAFFEILPYTAQTVDLAVSGGDSMTVTLKQPSSGQWQILIRDNTNHQSADFTAAYDSSLSSADWIQEAPSNFRRILPLDNFGTIQFTGGWTTENGQTVSISGASATAITLADSSGEALAIPSSLGGGGASFSITRTNVSAAQPSVSISEPTRGYPRSFGRD